MMRKVFVATLTAGLIVGVLPQAGGADKKKSANEQPRETVAKPLTEKEKRKREEKLRKESRARTASG